MFLGTHTPRLDDKGRIALPARFRPELERGVVICKGQDRCLYVYPVAEFERVTAPLRTATVADRGARNFSRILFASAKDDTPDSQGRVTIPPMLRDYAGLSKDCVVNGAMTRIEIWDVQNWQDYLQANEQAFADLSEEVLPEGFQLG